MLKKLILPLFLLSFLIGTPAQAQTDELSIGFGNMNNLLAEIREILKEFKETFEDYYGISIKGDTQGNDFPYQAPSVFKTPDIDDTKALLGAIKDFKRLVQQDQGEQSRAIPLTTPRITLQENKIAVTTDPKSPDLTKQNIIRALATPPYESACKDCPTDFLNADDIMHGMSVLPLASPYVNNYFSGEAFRNIEKEMSGQGEDGNTGALNLNTVLSPLAYQGDNIAKLPLTGSKTISIGAVDIQVPVKSQPLTPLQKAMAFIKFATFQAEPIKLLAELPDHGENASAAKKLEFRRYMTRLRSYLAQQSIAVSNLNQMVARRIKKPAKKGLSQLELEHNMATRRFSEDWLNLMERAAPMTLQRETLYVLSEINYQLYENRLMQERLLATMSAMQLQNLNLFMRDTINPEAGGGPGSGFRKAE